MRQWVALILLFSSLPSWAEMKQFGNYQVHYSVFTTDFLLPDVAAAYNITRAADRAMINISVRQSQRDHYTVAVKGRVVGTISDLVHRKPLEFREIVEQDALYYIADFEFINEETLYFDIDVTPADESAVLSVEFQQKLYVD